MGHKQSHDRYLSQRGGVWQYRRRVPGDIADIVGQQFWKQSLKTGMKAEATKAARALAVEHDQIIEAFRSMPELAKYRAKIGQLEIKLAKAMVAADRDKANVIFDERILAIENFVAALDKSIDGGAKAYSEYVQAGQQLEAEQYTEPMKRALWSGNGASELSDQLRRMHDMHARISSEPSDEERQQRLDELDEQAALRSVRRKRHAKKRAKLALLGLAEDAVEDPTNPFILSATEQWLGDRKQNVATARRHRVAVRRFVELHGNVPVGEVTKDNVREYVKTITNLADHRRLPTPDRGTLKSPKNVNKLSAPTVCRHLASIKALLAWCAEQDYVTVNLARDIRPPKDTRPKALRRRPFSRKELRMFFAGADRDDIRWMIKLGAATGARLEELAQLARDNVKEIDGIWAIEIDDLDGRKLKNADSVRVIPVHPKLIEDDFIEFATKGKGDLVFSAFKSYRGQRSNLLSGRFARIMDRVGLNDPRLTFHSLRHTFKSEMTRARVDPDVRRDVLGHSRNKNAHDSYGGVTDLKTMADELKKVVPY